MGVGGGQRTRGAVKIGDIVSVIAGLPTRVAVNIGDIVDLRGEPTRLWAL